MLPPNHLIQPSERVDEVEYTLTLFSFHSLPAIRSESRNYPFRRLSTNQRIPTKDGRLLSSSPVLPNFISFSSSSFIEFEYARRRITCWTKPEKKLSFHITQSPMHKLILPVWRLDCCEASVGASLVLDKNIRHPSNVSSSSRSFLFKRAHLRRLYSRTRIRIFISVLSLSLTEENV